MAGHSRVRQTGFAWGLATLLCIGAGPAGATGTASASDAAEAGQPPPAPTAPLTVAGLWRIDQARVEPILDRRQARIEFGADGQLRGHTSCNELTAHYTLSGDLIRIGPVSTSHNTCASLQLEQEDRILSALEAAVTARVRPDGLLELRDVDERGVLRGTRFEAAP